MGSSRYATTVLYLLSPFGALFGLSIYLALIDLHDLITALLITCTICSVLVLYAKFTSDDYTAEVTFKKWFIVSFCTNSFILCIFRLPSPLNQPVEYFAIFVISILLYNLCYKLVEFAQEAIGGRSRHELQFLNDHDRHNTAGISLSVAITFICVFGIVVITKRNGPNLFQFLINQILKHHEN